MGRVLNYLEEQFNFVRVDPHELGIDFKYTGTFGGVDFEQHILEPGHMCHNDHNAQSSNVIMTMTHTATLS